MPATSAKNYALQTAAASDLGLGGNLALEAQEIENRLKNKKPGDDENSISQAMMNGGPLMGWGGAGTRGMVGAAAGDLGLTAF